MTRRIRLFQRSEMATECDICNERFDLVSGGACVQCRKILCSRHLHGSWVRRLMIDFGSDPVCCECRRPAA